MKKLKHFNMKCFSIGISKRRRTWMEEEMTAKVWPGDGCGLAVKSSAMWSPPYLQYLQLCIFLVGGYWSQPCSNRSLVGWFPASDVVRHVFPQCRPLLGCLLRDGTHHHDISSRVALLQALLELCIGTGAGSVGFPSGNTALPHGLTWRNAERLLKICSFHLCGPSGRQQQVILFHKRSDNKLPRVWQPSVHFSAATTDAEFVFKFIFRVSSIIYHLMLLFHIITQRSLGLTDNSQRVDTSEINEDFCHHRLGLGVLWCLECKSSFLTCFLLSPLLFYSFGRASLFCGPFSAENAGNSDRSLGSSPKLIQTRCICFSYST